MKSAAGVLHSRADPNSRELLSRTENRMPVYYGEK